MKTSPLGRPNILSWTSALRTSVAVVIRRPQVPVQGGPQGAAMGLE
jgi:hypothetical protein